LGHALDALTREKNAAGTENRDFHGGGRSFRGGYSPKKNAKQSFFSSLIFTRICFENKKPSFLTRRKLAEFGDGPSGLTTLLIALYCVFGEVGVALNRESILTQ
jgi:hypothetical protein